MLPQTLLCLLSAYLAAAQSTLTLNTLSAISPSNLPNPPKFTLPPSNNLSVSIGLCSDPPSPGPPRFLLTNDTTSGNVWEIDVVNGLGIWTGRAIDGGVLTVENGNGMSFEIGVSDTAPFHERTAELPLLGDTTSNQALLFSHSFFKVTSSQPSYPNYTLPPANLSLLNSPTSVPNFTLILSATSTSSLATIPQTGCRLSTVASTGTILNQTLWLRDGEHEGWRMQWLVEGLNPSTNYTAYVVETNTKVSGPIFFVTKSASFSCALVHSLPYCPSTSYAVPLPPPPSSFPAYDASTLPPSISTPILAYLTNFTTTLTTFACGRDLYSQLKSCADCQRAYRKWLCSISFPRCAEGTSPSSSLDNQNSAQHPLPALSQQQPDFPQRNPALPPFSSSYTALLPCLETCTAVDRACPNFLGFRCPAIRFGADRSYGVGFMDSGRDGEVGGGRTGRWIDQWGNIWCNGS